jgi:hypothetical protein
MQKLKTKYGSALVFSLMVLFIGVVAALGIASTTIISQKMSGTTGKSVSSFQVADSGAEIILQKIYKNEAYTLKELVALGGISCSNGIISGNIGNSDKTYRITFKDESDNLIASCNSTETIASLKSIGTYASTSRAVEMAVAAGGEGITGGCMVRQATGYLVEGKWGSGCKNNGTSVGEGGNPEDSAYSCGNTSYNGGGDQIWFYMCIK